MTQTIKLSLAKLYLDSVRDKANLTPIEQLTRNFLTQKPIESELIDSLILPNESSEPASPLTFLNELRDLLTINLLIGMTGGDFKYKVHQLEAMERLKERRYWNEFQLEEALWCANSFFCAQNCEINPIKTGSGAAPLEVGSHWDWARLPHLQWHAELGLIWILLGKLSTEKKVIEAGAGIADWQVNILDSRTDPMLGLFCREEEGDRTNLLILHSLLFTAASSLGDRPHYSSLAEKQLQSLQEIVANEGSNIHPLYPLIEVWLEQFERKDQSSLFVLPQTIFDPHTAFAGIRSENLDAACTLSGGGTGMGSYRFHEVAILTWGPQREPLGDCTRFGIYRSIDDAEHPITLHTDKNGFSIKGRVELPREKIAENQASFRNGGTKGGWLDCQQELKGGILTITISAYPLDPLEPLAFAFFAKGYSCTIDREQTLHPRSFDKYHGGIQPITIDGTEGTIHLTALPGKGELQIIPLAGGAHFWGADFLIAYILEPKVLTYTWKITGVK
jgi:hypothetical protein